MPSHSFTLYGKKPGLGEAGWPDPGSWEMGLSLSAPRYPTRKRPSGPAQISHLADQLFPGSLLFWSE